MISSSALASTPLCGSTDTDYDVALSFTQILTALSYDVSLQLTQNIVDVYDVSLQLNQTISDVVYDVNLSLNQSIAAVYDVNLSLFQNVYDSIVTTQNWVNWDVSVRVNYVNVSADLINAITIYADKDAARIADFSLLLTATIEPISWIGRLVEINYIQNNGASWRRFTGFIERADFDINTDVLVCKCTDDLQRVLDGYSNQQLDTLIDGHWSEHVFNKDNSGWDYANDLLKTVNKTIFLNSNRQIIVADLQNKITADYSFNGDLILDDSVNVSLVQRNDLVNHIDVQVNLRYSRLFHAEKKIYWKDKRDFCENFANPVIFPSEELLKLGVEDGQWKLLNATYSRLWDSGAHGCSGRLVYYRNNYPDGARGFYALAGFRWRQSVTETYNVQVSDSMSISKHTKLKDTLSTSIDAKTTEQQWATDDDNYSTIPGGFKFVSPGYWSKDDVDNTEVNDAINTKIAQAVTSINKSHQQNIVSFQLPCSPFLEIGQTIEVNEADIHFKGILSTFTEVYDFSKATPISTVNVSISSGGSGKDVVQQPYTAPEKLKTDEIAHFYDVIYLPTQVATFAKDLTTDPNATGLFLSSDEPAEIKIPFPAVADENTENKQVSSDQAINITVPDNLFLIN